MELDERKVIILKTIIKNYLETGEPVGSRTISKYCGLNLSSATIRNEMSDLEEMGYITQPHTSAGRIPSDKGYRFYVDSIMQENERKLSTMTNLMIERVDKLERVLKTVVKSLASDTNYAALISGPSLSENRIKYLQLTPSDNGHMPVILVLQGNIMRSEIVSVPYEVDHNTAMNLTLMLNNYLSGLSLSELSKSTFAGILQQAGEHAELVKVVLGAVVTIVQSEGDRDIFTSGATNIFKYPELTGADRAAELISAFEEKDRLKELVEDVASASYEGQEVKNGGLQVFIGGEGPVRNMQDCSLVTAHYELEGGLKGVIGVIGPKRMDYEKVLNSMQSLMDQFNNTLKEKQE